MHSGISVFAFTRKAQTACDARRSVATHPSSPRRPLRSPPAVQRRWSVHCSRPPPPAASVSHRVVITGNLSMTHEGGAYNQGLKQTPPTNFMYSYKTSYVVRSISLYECLSMSSDTLEPRSYSGETGKDCCRLKEWPRGSVNDTPPFLLSLCALLLRNIVRTVASAAHRYQHHPHSPPICIMAAKRQGALSRVSIHHSLAAFIKIDAVARGLR